MRNTMSFTKGFIVGSMLCGAITIISDPPSSCQIRRAKRKVNRMIRNIGLKIEDVIK